MTEPDGTATVPTKTPLPAPPGKRLSQEQIFEYIGSLNTADDWPHAVLYLYRYWPIIDRKLTDPDNPNYIEVISEPYTLEDLIRRHGSGSYSIKVNDLNRPKAQTICESTFSVNDPDAPPVLDIREVVRGHLKNASYVQGLIARGELSKDNPMQQPAAGSDAQTAALLVPLIREMMSKMGEKKPDNIDGQLVPKIMDMFSKASDKSIEMALRQVKPEATATDQLVMFDKIIGLVEKMKGEKPAEDSTLKLMLAHITEELREERKANRELMNKLLERKNGSGDEDEPKGMMKTVMETLLTKALDGLGEGGGGGERQMKWWQEYMPMFISEGNKALGQLKDLAGMFMFGRAQQMPHPGQPGNPAAPPGIPAPTADNPAASGGEQPVNPIITVLNECTGPLIQHLKSPDLTGRDFAEWFIYGVPGTGSGGYGPRMFEQLQTIGKETLINACKGYPPIAQQLQGVAPERITSFLEDFFIGPPDDDEEDEPGDPIDTSAGPTVVPPRKPRAKKGDA